MGKLQQRYPPRSAHLGVEWLVVQPNAQDVGSELCLRLQETPKHRWHIAAPLEASRDRATEVIAVGAVLSWCGVGEDGSPVRGDSSVAPAGGCGDKPNRVDGVQRHNP